MPLAGVLSFAAGTFAAVAVSSVWPADGRSPRPTSPSAKSSLLASSPSTTLPPPAPNSVVGETIAPSEAVSDPFVMTAPNLDYLYSSGFGASGPNVPLRTFQNIEQLSSVSDAMPQAPSWAQGARSFWGPDVRKVGNVYVMWFTGLWKNTMPTGGFPRCIGVATSSSPYGPFVDPAPAPAICQLNDFGDIDPRTFVDPSGQEWLYWKSDDNAGNTPQLVRITKFWAQKLAPDGTTLEGSPTIIYQADKDWQVGTVEAPQMVLDHGRYYLFFSGNSSASAASGIGLGTCAGPAGPCQSPYPGPWVGSNPQGAGPGEISLFQQGGNTWLLYTPHAIYTPYSAPQLAVARVAFGPDGPYVARFNGETAGIPVSSGGDRHNPRRP
jgi:hypothetical protein